MRLPQVTALTALATVAVIGAMVIAPGGGLPRKGASRAVTAEAYGKLPMAFEANGGRTDPRVDFIARGPGWSLFLTPGESVLALGRGRRADVVRTRLLGAAAARGAGESLLPGRVNSLIGNDPGKWRTGIRMFGRVRYRSVYPGVDLVYYGHDGRLEYDFVVRPGAAPGQIGLGLDGAHAARLAANGDLLITTRAGTLRQLRPVAYQGGPHGRERVSARYVLGGRRVHVRVGPYDHRRALVIDPLLAYSTLLGGSSYDYGQGIAVDGSGSAYVTGYTPSTNFPTAGAYQGDKTGTDAFVTKLNPSGTALVYSTYLGGSSSDYGYAIAVNSSGNAYVAGQTFSSDFPVPNAADSTISGADAFATKLNTTGSGLSWSTFVGGSSSEDARGIAVASNGDAHVVGYTSSSDFPHSTNAYQGSTGGSNDSYLTVLNYSFLRVLACNFTCSPLARTYSTYLGGTGQDYALGVDIDGSDKTYVGGYTYSTAFPTKGSSATTTDPDAAVANTADGFVAKFDTAQSTAANTLVYSTYLGSNQVDRVNAISVTSSGTAHVAGETNSTTALPGRVATAPFDHLPASTSDYDGFVSSIGSTGSISSTAYLGGQGTDRAKGIAVHVGSTTTEYVVGETASDDFPTQPSAPGTLGDPQAFVVKRYSGAINPDIWSLLLGGGSNDGDYGEAIAVDAQGKAYVSGRGGFDFPTTAGAFQTNYGGNTSDAFAARFDQTPPTVTNGPANGEVVNTQDVSFDYSLAGFNFKCSVLDSSTHKLTNTSHTACNTPPVNYTGLAEGPQTFEVVSVDDAGDESDPVYTRRTFNVDTTPPPAFDLTDPADGATVSTQPTLSWQQSHDAGTAVTYHLLIDGNDAQQVAESACASNVCSAQLANKVVTGPHTWKVHAVDGGGHATDSTSQRSFNAVDPPVPKLTIAPNPVLVGRDVTFDGTASNDASHTIVKYEWDLDGDGTFELDTGAAGTTKKAYPSAGTINVGLRVQDASGVTATTTGELKVTTLGTPGALLGVTIDNGAQYTRTPNVVVTATFPPTSTTMLISNDGGFMNAISFPPQKETKWKLDSSGPERLPKTIYVRFFTGPFPSETFQDDIILDEIPPKVVNASVGPAGPGAAAAQAAKLRSWKLKVKATDSNSGVGYVQATATKKKPGRLLKYKRKLTVKSAKRPKWVRARDKAGNYSKWRKLR